MIAEFGEAALWASLIWGFLGALRKPAHLFFRYESLFLALMLIIAMGCLMYAFVTSDFTLKTVVMNSHTQQPMIYKISALWSSHEGSMLLWVLLLGVMHALFFLQKPNPQVSQEFYAWVGRVNTITLGIFLIYIVFFANPFVSVGDAVHEGLGMNPLLQDPSMLFHPPSLYLGLVGFLIPYAMGVALWLCPESKEHMQKQLYPWMLFAWGTLTLGMTLGSFWAYYELGWGGWWFWDPVENLSILPWFMGIAALHGLQKPFFSKVVHYLILKIFPVFLLGTFLVRSGLLASVHSFAAGDNQIVYLFIIACLSFLPVLFLFIQDVRGVFVKGEGAKTLRGLLLNTNVAIFAVAALLIGLATFIPAYLNFQGTGGISVGPGFYHVLVVPILLLGLGVMVLSQLFIKFWGKSFKGQGLQVYQSVQWPLFFIIGSTLGGAYFWPSHNPLAFLGIALVFSHAYSLWQGRSQNKNWMKYFHTAVMVSVAGMAIDHLGRIETEVPLALGQKVVVGSAQFTLQSQHQQKGVLFDMDEAGVQVASKDGQSWGTLYPQKRLYHRQNAITSEVAILTCGLSQYYVALGGMLPDGKRMIFIAYHPAVILIWLGGVLLSLLSYALIFQRRRS